MKKTISLKWIIISVLVIMVAIVLTVGAKVSINADTKKDALINREGPALKIGRYYIDGDTEQYYLDVTEDTIQLCNVDYLEYAWVGNELGDTKDDEYISKMTGLAEKRAEEYAKKYEYKAINKSSSDGSYNVSFIFTDWIETDGNYSGTGYTLVDENTITGGDSVFIYYDEELGDTVYKTETPTRVVDSLSYKEKNK